MTNKRKHQLERIVRVQYSQFETMLIGKINSFRILSQIRYLFSYVIEYLYNIYDISHDEKLFMLKCSTAYQEYYKKLMIKIYG